MVRPNNGIRRTALRAAADAERQAGKKEESPRGTGDRVKVSELIRFLERDGWQLVRTKGSHRQFR